jgi:hypothetical protein
MTNNLPGFECSNNNGFKITFQNGITVSVKWSRSSYCERYSPELFPDARRAYSDLDEAQVWSSDAEVLISGGGEFLCWGLDEVRGCVLPDGVATIISIAQSAKAEDLENLRTLDRLGLAPRLHHTGVLEAVRRRLIQHGLASDCESDPHPLQPR